MKFRIPAVLAAMSAALNIQAEAQPGVPEVRSVEVAVQGDIPVDETFVKSFVSIREGSPFDQNALQRDVRALLDSARFSYVAAQSAEAADGGATVRFTVEGRARLGNPLTFQGLDAFSRSRAERESDLRQGDFVDAAIADAAAKRLEAYYRKNRYFDAKVESYFVVDDNGFAEISLLINEGEKYSVDFLEFEGATALSDSDLAEYAQQHSWYNPLSWVVTPRLSDADLEIVADTARKKYFDAGYLDATVSSPRKILDGTDMRVVYDVVEGPLYHIGSVSIEGASIFPSEQLLAAAALQKGAPAGAAELERARKSILEYYTARGYADTSVTPSTSLGEEATIDLVFHVREGSLVTVRSVNVLGNTVTKDKVIRREIGLDPGAPLNLVQAELSRKRLQNSGYFSDVRFNDVPIPGDSNRRDVSYEVTEQGTGQMMLGAAFSSVDHLVGLFSISQNNFDIFNWPTFKGGGQKARFDLSASGDSTSANISLVEPWFLDRRLSLQVDLFLNERSYREYDIKRAGGSIGVQKFLPWIGNVGLYYSLQKAWLDDVMEGDFHPISDPDRVYRFTDEDDDYWLGSMKLSWTYDTRDNPLVPRTGTRATASASLFNSAFGSDYDFYLLDARAYTYYTLPFGLYLSLSAQVATADTLGGDDDIPIGSRFFLGGSRHARGFRHRHLSPKARPDGADADSKVFSPYGGLTEMWATAELSVPIAPNFRLATFLDAGNVWEDSYDISFDEIATSAGVGLRIDFQGFPVRFDYAHVIDSPDDYARHRAFVIWFGFDN